MAQRYVGIEIGARTLRVMRLTGSGRALVAEHTHEEPIPNMVGGLDGLDGALKELVHSHAHVGDVIAVSVPAGHAMVTRLTLPFDDPKVVEQVLPAQLAGKLPVSDDHVVSFTVTGAATGEEEGFDVLVVAYPKDLAAAHLESLSKAGIEAQLALPLTLAEHRAARFLYPDSEESYALLDIGVRCARLTFMRGTEFVSSRSLLMGSQLVTESIGETLGQGPEAAEKLKLAAGFVAPTGEEHAWFEQLASRGDIDTDQVHDPVAMAKAARNGLRAMVVALRQSLTAFSMSSGEELNHIVLAGGGARLRGLGPYLAKSLGVDVRPVRLEANGLEQVAPNPLANPELVGALGLALCAADAYSGGVKVNLRRGELAFKGTMEFIKERAIALAVLVALMIFALVFMLASRYHALSVEREQLKANLGEATSALFGSEMYDQTSIQGEIESAKGFTFIPKATAFEHFMWISNALSTQMYDVDFEIDTLEIDSLRKVVVIKADTESDEGVPRMIGVLEQYHCFPDEIDEPQTQKTRGRVVFTLRIDAGHCFGAVAEEE